MGAYMRVIAGTAKRITLETIEGSDTRPTTDRIKETLFNIIGTHMWDTSFLDLFSGSGAIGIEALSRGAKRAVFIEQNIKAVACIKKNLHKTKLESNAEVIRNDAVTALNHLKGREKFDYIFLDPPYDCNLEKEVLSVIIDADILADEALIIVEASINTDFSYLNNMGYAMIKEKTYRTNKHVFLERLV